MQLYIYRFEWEQWTYILTNYICRGETRQFKDATYIGTEILTDKKGGTPDTLKTVHTYRKNNRYRGGGHRTKREIHTHIHTILTDMQLYIVRCSWIRMGVLVTYYH